MNSASFEQFATLDIRAGTVLQCELFARAKKPAYKLEIDFGEVIGVKTSSAQLTTLYSPSDLVGKQVLAVINFPPRNIAGFLSEVLVLGAYSAQGVVLVTPERTVQNGDKLG